MKRTHARGASLPFCNYAASASVRHKKKQQPHSLGCHQEMPFLSSNFLAAPSLPSRKRSQVFARRDESEELSDLDVSFASNVSLNSPPHESIPLSPGGEPMDISPAPPKRPADVAKHRARALTTSGTRLFGNDLSNGSSSLLPSPQLDAGSTSKETGTTSGKRIQRSALPTEWLCAPRAPEPALPISREPSSPMDDAMDVDTSYNVNPPPPKSFSLSPSPSAPNDQFKPLYFQAPSPRRSFESPSAHMGKRRSLSPDTVRSIHEHSSPGLCSSPSEAKLDRLSNGAQASRAKPSLQGLGAPSASFLKKPRRPVLSAMLPPSDFPIQSAYPSLAPSPGFSLDDSSPSAPPVRRAFSAFLPPAQYVEPDEEDTSFEGPDMSSPAQAYSQRQHVKTIRRCDGTEDFRPLTGTSPLVNHNSPSSSRFLAPGLPGFGDNEAHGKILPCHRVTEDGLMRIKHNTLEDLICGKYQDKVSEYVIIDCRFDYEFNGGHIMGAININTTAGIEDIVLSGLFGRPEPSVSGDNKKKKILIFHCEFSAKRAPTFAKHLRAKDRALNNRVYPRIYFPEVYILEGGYCEWFKNCSHRCSPQAYVTMDDPNHATSRREDLDHFRKARFGRIKSYSYADSSNKPPMQQQVQPKRNTAPSAPQSLFAAATAARSRRGGALTTLAEDANTTLDGDETDTDIGDSPCPPPTKATTFKGKKLMNARPIIRAETYGPARMPY